jgi:hypothetical protein
VRLLASSIVDSTGEDREENQDRKRSRMVRIMRSVTSSERPMNAEKRRRRRMGCGAQHVTDVMYS